MNNHYQLIANELKIKYDQVKNSLDLLNSGATVPFISRYRKEATGSLDEVMITQIRDLYQKWVELDKRRAAIIDSITEQGKMTPQLQAQLEASTTLSQLEDIYLPYRPKRKTRATVAIDKGLEPLAKLIFKQQFIDLKKTAQSYINQSKEVNNVEEALQGARDIIAEWISEDIKVRSTLREKFVRNSTIYSRVIKGKEDAGSKFEIYFKSEEPLWKAPSHRVLAMLRGEEEGFLKITIKPQDELALNLIRKFTVKGNNSCCQQVLLAGEDSYKRLLQPQMETEMRRFYKEKSRQRGDPGVWNQSPPTADECSFGTKNDLSD